MQTILPFAIVMDQCRLQPLIIYGPTGVRQVVAGFNDAYILDREYRVRHHGAALLPPALGKLQAKVIPTGVVWEDSKLTITAFNVDHSPIEPAYGYRIDYQGRSIVVSGDTVVTDSLFQAAEGADLLFHDALSPETLAVMITAMRAAGRIRAAQIMTDVLDYHADVNDLETRSAAADIDQLVLYHMVPVPGNLLLHNMFVSKLTNTTIIAEDLMLFELPAGSSSQAHNINIRYP